MTRCALGENQRAPARRPKLLRQGAPSPSIAQTAGRSSVMRSSMWRIFGAVIVCGVLLAACSSDTTTTSPAGGTGPPTDTAMPSSSSFSATGSPVSSAIDGKWNGSYQPTGGGSGTFSVNFSQSGSSLNGTLSISVTCLDGAKVTGKVEGDSIEFGSVKGQCEVEYKGTIKGDQMSGTYDIGQGVGGTWKASKA